jgi:peptidoglycan/xylan/chitin deacetylase (PgdA/CDA1 family)
MPDTPYAYWPWSERPPLEWPDGKRLAFYVGLNIEHFEVGKPSTSLFAGTVGLELDPLNHGWRDYGTRVGVWRLMELLDEHGMRASCLVNSMVCEEYPQVIAAGVERDWAWCGHGHTNSAYWTAMDEESERAELATVVERLEAATGKKPTGWLAPALTQTANTPRLLAEHGFTYVMDWCCDDQPFPMRPELGRLIGLPYAIEVNDISMFLGVGTNASEFAQIARDQFDVLYEDAQRGVGSVMSLAIHPFLVGQPWRLKYLRDFLAHVADHDDVWVTTSDEIADWYLEHHYDDALASMPGGPSAAG